MTPDILEYPSPPYPYLSPSSNPNSPPSFLTPYLISIPSPKISSTYTYIRSQSPCLPSKSSNTYPRHSRIARPLPPLSRDDWSYTNYR
ncbi:hypothetical protein NEOLEDRAFT_1140653 [Neolentinus lepideus HHB14362 ss-1]|uniref:Uncharacterized protein n=1 Tax=Neolentinus lepideus HHB14362 ss-1 TaxID=1314782 RepID=A0A165P551_9AGAM|nr:hypothetical protein NEOLEDRAFT_1140653 [Neolentinus lepideus HHB14362 ss-1]